MQQILQSYLRRLTNLTGNNRSLLLLKLYADQFIDVHDFEFLDKKPSFSIIEQLIAQRSRISLGKTFDSRDHEINNLSRKLKRLQRTEKFIYEERGAKDLYVGWPFVKGKLSDGTLVRCPLIFFPVDLAEEGGEWVLKLRDDILVTLNKTFILAYAYYNKVKLDESLIEKAFDEFDKDSRVFRTALYQLFKESPIEINFNQENFIDKLEPFESLSKKDLQHNEKEGELKLYPEAVLGIFPQAGSYLVPDYLSLMEKENFQDIEQFFESKSLEDDKPVSSSLPFQNNFLNQVKEEQAFTPFKMDAFQENALKAVKRGNSIVVHGPPGTGKSQLICNLISDFIARGKRVLLVCQKRAALDVVYKRMEEHDAKDFIALVHDFKNDRKEIYKQIADQIERLYEYKLKNNSLDAIQLERKFLQSSRRIDQITEELEELKFALFDQEECGLSVKELYLTSNINAPSVSLNQEYKYFRFDNMEAFMLKFKYYILFSSRFKTPRYPWRNRRSFKDLTASDFQNMQTILKDIPEYQARLYTEVNKIIQAKAGFKECEEFLKNEDKIREFIALINDETVYDYFAFMEENRGKHMDQLWISNTERVLLECFRGEGPDTSLETEDLGEFQEVLEQAIDAGRNFIRWFWWKSFSRSRFVFNRTIQANGLKFTKKGLSILIEKIDNRLNLEHNITKLKKEKWLKEIPTAYNKLEFQTWFTYQKKALNAALIFHSLRSFKDHITLNALSNSDLSQKLEAILSELRDLPEKKQSWLQYLTPVQMYQIIDDEGFGEALLKSLKTDFEDLCEYDKLQDSLEPHEEQLISKILEVAEREKYTHNTETRESSDALKEKRQVYSENEPGLVDSLLSTKIDGEEIQELNAEAVEQLFQNSLRLAWIEHIEIKYPVLRTVTSMKFRSLEKELQECVKEKLQVSKEILLLKARERTYHDVEFNRLNNMVTYRDIQHQVTKKKRIWPIRKLVAEHDEALFNLVPCWMASPESVSAIFPMKQLFDLVIFDEASQCFSERGIPAMYRGRQIVVTGDDKQLSPNDLYQVRWEEETTEEMAMEVDSLLDLSKQYLMEIQLQQHYRSRSLSLIDFSNQHFYKSKLRLLPDFKDINKDEPAITFKKVPGIWENNTNKIEAEEVVSLLKDLAFQKPGKSIGVVTFNAVQQNEISDLLDYEASVNGAVFPEDLFVKNIENIQGDERDIIIFSTAYAPDAKGKLMMNFGTLNTLRGENRLNVAITRAKEKIYIISSILSADLKVETSKNEGPKLLKKYLQYAWEVSEGKYIPQSFHASEHNNTWFLKNRIATLIERSTHQFDISEELPFADLTLKKDDRYKALFITDDDLYHQSISIKDPHVYTPFILHQKKWKFKGFFSREYWMDKPQMEEQIMKFLSQVGNDEE